MLWTELWQFGEKLAVVLPLRLHESTYSVNAVKNNTFSKNAHLTMREEIRFTSKTCLAWRNSSIFLLSEKNGAEKWFYNNLSLVHQFQVFLKTWNWVQIHDEAEEVRHLETTFSDCCPSSEINFIQVIIKLHKFILKYILSKRLLTIILNFWFILYITQFIHYTILNFSELLYNCTKINTHIKKN